MDTRQKGKGGRTTGYDLQNETRDAPGTSASHCELTERQLIRGRLFLVPPNGILEL